MSDNSKYFDYYLVEGEEVKALIDSYEKIRQQRKNILLEATEKAGAAAWVLTNSWGSGGLLSHFAWEKDFEFPCPITVKKEISVDNKGLIVARGKGNTKEGKAFNKNLNVIREGANSKLKSLPQWMDYITNHYGILKTGFGKNVNQGISLLTTYGGVAPGRNDCLLFAIPNNEDKKHGTITIPARFQKITYGAFYDMANSEE